MNSSDVAFLLDIAIVILLIPTIVYAWLLNKRLSTLRQSKEEMLELIEAFNKSTIRAETSIPRLRAAADSSGKELQEHIEKARVLRDDLAFMVERSESLTEKLQQSISTYKETEIIRKPISSTSTSRIRKTQTKRKVPASAFIQNSDDIIEGSIKQMEENDISSFDYEDDRSEAERELLKALQAVK